MPGALAFLSLVPLSYIGWDSFDVEKAGVQVNISILKILDVWIIKEDFGLKCPISLSFVRLINDHLL